MFKWFIIHVDEAKRRIHSMIQLRKTNHGNGNYVFGNINIIEPANLAIGDLCRINHNCYINASNGLTLGDDVTLSANVSIVTTGIDYLSWARGERKHITTGGNYWQSCLDWRK